jgi:hypothetical protein
VLTDGVLEICEVDTQHVHVQHNPASQKMDVSMGQSVRAPLDGHGGHEALLQSAALVNRALMRTGTTVGDGLTHAEHGGMSNLAGTLTPHHHLDGSWTTEMGAGPHHSSHDVPGASPASPTHPGKHAAAGVSPGMPFEQSDLSHALPIGLESGLEHAELVPLFSGGTSRANVHSMAGVTMVAMHAMQSRGLSGESRHGAAWGMEMKVHPPG